MNSVIWIYDGVLVLMSAAVGYFVGQAGLGMAELIGMGAWASVIMLTVFAILAFLVLAFMDRGLDTLFPSGVKAAPAGTKKTNRYEQRRKRNGWIGFFFGVAAAIIASMFYSPEQIMGLF